MEMTSDHIHPQRFEKIVVNRLRQLILRGAEEVTDKTLHEIFVDITIEEEYDDVTHLVNFKTMEPGMRGRRKRNYPRIPHTIEQVDELMQEASLDLNKNYHGIIETEDGTKCGILFYHDKLFKQLKEWTELGFDGTFFVVPHPFYQLWTGKCIHL